MPQPDISIGIIVGLVPILSPFAQKTVSIIWGILKMVKWFYQNQGKHSISSIVGGYKSAVTKHAYRLGLDFAWQTRFHDHIIRDKRSFQKISNYILNNPRQWAADKFYPYPTKPSTDDSR